MKPVTVTLARLSVCPCGFFALSDHLPIGVEYQIIPALRENCTWTCGGCGQVRDLVAVLVVSRQNKPGTSGWMPEELFSHHPSNRQPTATPKTKHHERHH